MVSPELEAQLRRLAFEARAQAPFWATGRTARLFAGVSGLSALFPGRRASGKSMAAQVIARELGVNLLIVDLATTISSMSAKPRRT